MTIDIENDHIVIAVGSKGGGEVGTKMRPQKVGAGVADADAEAPRVEDGEEEGWKKVEKGKKRGPGRLTRAVTAQKKIIDFNFSQFSETSKKRRAETALNEADKQPSMAEQIAQLKELVLRMLQQQEEDRKDRARLEKQQEQTMKQQEELKQMFLEQKQLLLEHTVCKPTYSQTLQGPKTKDQLETTTNRQVREKTPPPRPPIEDKKMIIINTTRAPKQEKQDYTKMKEALDSAINRYDVTKGCQIRCLRPLAGDRVGVVFSTEDEAARARKHVRWHQSAMPGARIQSEKWYPVKFDGVAKEAVLDTEINDDKTLRKDVCATFQNQNNALGLDCTANMVRWISKPNPLKRTGSLVLWLRHQLSAERLLEMGTALFGATDAYCTKWDRPTAMDGLCYKCNTYGHKQFHCTKEIKCGICTESHHTRECTNKDKPKCSACAGNHAVFDRKCILHPQHVARPDKADNTVRTSDWSNGNSRSSPRTQDIAMMDSPSSQC